MIIIPAKFQPSSSIGMGSLANYITLNLNISAYGQDIKNLAGRFWATNIMIIPVKFQLSSSTGIGRKWGDRLTRDITPFSHDPYIKKP